MSRSYHHHQTLLDAETYRRHGIKPTGPVAPTAHKPWDGVKNSELRGLMTPAPDATRQNQVARAALHATTTDELRTEGHQIKHRNNPHE